jgi:exoribonuclease-2
MMIYFMCAIERTEKPGMRIFSFMEATNEKKDRSLLRDIAHKAMVDRGMIPNFSTAVIAELAAITASASTSSMGIMVDLRKLLWCSLDNDDSKDLDQLSVAERIADNRIKILIAISDVDAIVKRESAIDRHAQQNTTSVYTIAEVFPMIPEKLSTDITSLNFEHDRLAVVIEMTTGNDGTVIASALYQALVRNRARLSYNETAAWLDGTGEMPASVKSYPGMEGNLRLQDEIAHKMRSKRFQNGSLSFETIEAKPVFSGEKLLNFVPETHNRAKEIIEDFMIAANGITAQYLTSRTIASIRRMVRTPKRWDRIITLAAEYGAFLPDQPDSKALDLFLVSSKKKDPLRFPDLSLSVIKLLGSGEYVVHVPGMPSEGHFGLAVRDYSHSTAPNRRYPDLITQRLLKAAIASLPSPYTNNELAILAAHCTEAEDSAKKVERQVEKSAAALILESRVGDRFDGIVTGASQKGTWVRIMDPPLEGKLEVGFEGLDVGNRVTVQLVSTDVERGFIDFKRVSGK